MSMKRLLIYNNGDYVTMIFVSGTEYSSVLWADFSNTYKAVLDLKYSQLYCVTVSQQRIIFNKKNNDRNSCLSYITCFR